MIRILLLTILLFVRIDIPENIKSVYFSGGEQITYNAHYSFISAGEIIVTIDSNRFLVDSHVCYKAEVFGQTIGAVGVFAKITDRWVSYIDTASNLSYKFIRDQQENNYTLNEVSEFDRITNTCFVTTRKPNNSYELKTYRIQPGVQDMVSTYFELRNFDFEKVKKNAILDFKIFLEDTTLPIKIKYLGIEKIRTKIGRKRTFVFAPIFPETKNTIFVKENPVRTCITDDHLRIPVKIVANTKFGAIEVDIVEYKKPLKKVFK